MIGRFLAAAADLFSAPATAHVLASSTPIAEALHHPVLDLPHALPLAAAGLWAGQQGGRVRWAILGALLAGVAAGVVGTWIGIIPPWRAPTVFASMVVLGAAVGIRARASAWAAVSVAVVAGLYQGVLGTLPIHLGGTGHYPPQDMIVAALVLPPLASELAARARTEWAGIAVRILGSWIAAAGILLTALMTRLYFGALGAGS